MKFVLATLVASAAAQTADWTPCTKQDCSSKDWICCDTTAVNNDGTADATGTMICTDPTLKGVVPATIPTYGGQTYHCTHEQHKDAIAAGGADAASNLVVGIAATIVSAYMLA